MKQQTKNIGIEVPEPKGKCTDKRCPFHGTLKLHGRLFTGVVTRSKAPKTVQVEFEKTFAVKKYERFEQRTTRIPAHNPECINAEVGDTVQIMETRPISKTKTFVVISK